MFEHVFLLVPGVFVPASCGVLGMRGMLVPVCVWCMVWDTEHCGMCDCVQWEWVGCGTVYSGSGWDVGLCTVGVGGMWDCVQWEWVGCGIVYSGSGWDVMWDCV